MALGKMTLVILRQNQGLTGSKGRRSQVLPWLEAARLGMEIAAILCEEENPSAVFVHFIIFSCRSSDSWKYTNTGECAKENFHENPRDKSATGSKLWRLSSTNLIHTELRVHRLCR